MTASKDQGGKPTDSGKEPIKDPAKGISDGPAKGSVKDQPPGSSGASGSGSAKAVPSGSNASSSVASSSAPAGGPIPGAGTGTGKGASPATSSTTATLVATGKPTEPGGLGKPAAPSEPVKAAATGSSAVPPVASGKEADARTPSEPAKAGAVGSSALKAETGATGGATGSGPQSAGRVGAKDAVTDGPILDLKAKRIADPPAAKASEPAATGPGTPPRPEASRGPGLASVAASGLAGGLIGAGLLFALTQSGVLVPDTARLDALDGRIGALDQKVGALATRDAVAALDKRIGANEQALKPLPDAVKVASERAEAALKQAASAPQAGGTSDGPNTAPAAPLSELAVRLDALDQRVSALQEEPGRDQPAAAAAVATPGVDAGAIEALRRDVDERAKVSQSLAQRIEELQQNVDQRVKSVGNAVQSATDASRQALEAGRTQAEEATRANERRLTEQAARIDALGKTVDGAAKSATVEAALRIVAADRIATALAAGAPYSDALTSLRSTRDGDAGVLGPLEGFAETGAPTAAALAAAFRPIRDRVQADQRAAKARQVAETGGIADRLQSMASSIVQVKRTGDGGPARSAAGNDDGDPTAAVQNALDAGRIDEAAKAFAALPEPVRTGADAFGAQLKARAEADAAAQSLQAQAFKSLSAGR